MPTQPSGASPLSQLLGASPSTGELLSVPLTSIERNEAQPRTVFDHDALAALASSIEQNGVIQPIAVRRTSSGRFEIIAGERRWLAARLAGLTEVPAVVHDVDDRETLVLALVENAVREDLNPLETARAYAVLHDEFGVSVADIARHVGRSRPAISNTLRILELPDDILTMVEHGRLSEGHARALLTERDRVRQLRLARAAADGAMTVRELESQARAATQTVPPPAAARSKWNRLPDVELQGRVDAISERLDGVTARIKLADRGAKLELRIDDAAALDAVLAALAAPTPG